MIREQTQVRTTVKIHSILCRGVLLLEPSFQFPTNILILSDLLANYYYVPGSEAFKASATVGASIPNFYQ